MWRLWRLGGEGRRSEFGYKGLEQAGGVRGFSLRKRAVIYNMLHNCVLAVTLNVPGFPYTGD
jgi:hypothetical protein